MPSSDLGVIRLSEATFLFNFTYQPQRNATRNKGIRVGHTGLKLLPWSRCIGADNELVKFRYRARLCIEGVPGHVRQPKAIDPLFKDSTFIDELHCDKEKPEEEACVCLWVWTADPDGLAKTVTLEVVEPVTLLEDQLPMFSKEWSGASAVLKQGAAQLLKYPVILHLGRVMDYSTPPSSLSHQSADDIMSGLPDESLEEAWHTCHLFRWRIGVPNGGGAGWRVPAHDRLGCTARDDSPPRGAVLAVSARKLLPATSIRGARFGHLRQVHPPGRN